MTTRLLVSVRDEREARLALRGGAHLIDVKEPSRGSLGAADRAVVQAVANAVQRRASVSVALGELADVADVHRLAATPSVQYAKFGLAGCRSANEDWVAKWKNALDVLPRSIQPVAVVYADWQSANAPSPTCVIDAAVRSRCAAVLVDTFDKTRGNLFAHWSCHDVGEFVRSVRSACLMSAVAGSLDLECVAKVLPFRPDIVAVRGAACRGGRDGTLDESRVRDLAAAVGKSKVLATVTAGD